MSRFLNREPSPPRHACVFASHPLQYNLSFYMQYLARFPEYCLMAVAPAHENMAYSKNDDNF
jgi:hypothetical protein